MAGAILRADHHGGAGGDQLTADGGTVTERWKIDGTGTEGAEMVKDARQCIAGAVCVPVETRELEAMGLDADPGG